MKHTLPDYHNSILNVTNSILKYYNAPHKYSSLAILDEELKKGYNHIIYILLDGMGSNIINYHLDKDDALRKYMKSSITSVFPPTTVAATDTVLSGLPPISHGHVGWTQYFKEEDTDLVVFQNIDYYTNEAPKEDLREKYLKFPKIYDLINIGSPSVETTEFFPSFRRGGSVSFDEQIEKVLIKTHHTDQSFNYVYWIEPDLTEHRYGIYSNEVGNLLRKLNQSYEELINNITDDTIVITIADHGLTDIVEIPLFEQQDLLDLLRRKPSLEPRATAFFVKDGCHELFQSRFQELYQNEYTLYTKEAFLKTGLLGVGEKHPKLEEFLGDYIAIAKKNGLFIFKQSKDYLAHHAGLTEDEMMVPLIVYSKKSAK
jgi:hypothetical protein